MALTTSGVRNAKARGAHELRERVQQRASMTFRYAVATGRCARDPVADLRGAFTSPTRYNYAALGQKELPEFFTKLADYEGEPTTKLALRLLVLTFVRTGELHGACWCEFDLDAAEWRIPAEQMKMRQEHIVPLSRQALAVLRELQQHTWNGELLFPSRSKVKQPMSENTILYALYRMGYHSRATGHGFRATASTILNELGFAPEVIERQLAHIERNKVRTAYNRAMYLPERVRMMQHWADLLDALASGDKKVIAGKFGKIVIGRQRPDTTSGVVFVTLEDETGTTNVIVWRSLGKRQRRELLGARLLGVYGKVEREGPVVHVLAGRLVDLTRLLGALSTRSRGFH